jgi:hypothetical protein
MNPETGIRRKRGAADGIADEIHNSKAASDIER